MGVTHVRQAIKQCDGHETGATTRGGAANVNQHIQAILNDNASGAINSGGLTPYRQISVVTLS